MYSQQISLANKECKIYIYLYFDEKKNCEVNVQSANKFRYHPYVKLIGRERGRIYCLGDCDVLNIIQKADSLTQSRIFSCPAQDLEYQVLVQSLSYGRYHINSFTA